MLEVKICITLKKTITDPQGLAVKHALDSLGYRSVEEVRMGKLITVKLNLKSIKEAERQITEMCKKLLANPIIENYSFKIIEV